MATPNLPHIGGRDYIVVQAAKGLVPGEAGSAWISAVPRTKAVPSTWSTSSTPSTRLYRRHEVRNILNLRVQCGIKELLSRE